MNVKQVDKLSAQFAVSLSEATGLIASWLDDEDDNQQQELDVDNGDDDLLGLTKLTNSRAGLGSTNSSTLPFRDPLFNLNSRGASSGLGSKPGHESSSKSGMSHKALLAMKKKLPQDHKPQHKPADTVSGDRSDSDSETEGRSAMRTASKRTSTSFLDSYKKKKKSRK